MYDGVLVLPEEIGKGEEGQVVVGPLETGETGDYDYGQEEFFDVLEHWRMN